MPKTIRKKVKDLIELTKISESTETYGSGDQSVENLSDEELYNQMKNAERNMKRAVGTVPVRIQLSSARKAKIKELIVL